MSEPFVMVNQIDSTARITLNRPNAFNALGPDMITALAESLEKCRLGNPTLLIMTGTGRFFCYGVDFRGVEEGRVQTLIREMLPRYQSIIRSIQEFPAPTICVLNGHAAGAGLDLAMAADFRLAFGGIRLSEAFIRWGLVPDGGGTGMLPRLIGLQRARRMALTGEPVTAETALEWGLVDEVLDRDNPDPTLSAWIEKLENLPTETYITIRRMLRDHASLELDRVLEKERLEQEKRAGSSEFSSRVKGKV